MGHGARNLAVTGVHRPSEPPSNGPNPGSPTRRFGSFRDFFIQTTGAVPPPPIIIPWYRCWRIVAPEFLDDDGEKESEPAIGLSSLATKPLALPSFTSWGEYAS